MNREKEINQAAYEYNENYGLFDCDFNEAKIGFIDGAKWADKHPKSPWHDVKEELPNINIHVLVLTHSGNVVTTSMYIPRDVNGNILGDKEWKGSYAFRQSITHWMEIPELP